ncbi:hypothetical protein [Alteromonas lipolytica]|uniref:Uncharacterized protein n=1 Tax=Alteromonas lipolytica TaxID=1856405 RepID=A0A1E8FD90_9ALTE|nr:hypothetical protein [Alteromonas lipolytica]OFI33907.1 hypothetical protein BFC17_20295 [Alteromonas lipolytica]
MRVPESLLRRSVRLLNAINILHRQGYEKLGCSFWGGIDCFSWVAVVTSTDNMMVDREIGITNLINERADSFLHEANREGNDYFGWTDARNASAEQLAELMKLRFSALLDNCKGEHAENVAWLLRVIHQISITGKLPYAVFDETHALPDWTFLIGDREYVDYAPVCDVFRLGHQKYRFCAVNLNEHIDWHSAHRTIIDRIALGQVSVLPQFPQNTYSVFEMGAYWEGAVYFIAKLLELTSKEEFLRFLEGNKVRPVYGELFYRIYDSNGQLDYFVAYVVKQYLKSKPEYAGDLKDRWEKWLTYFEARNRYKHKSPQYMHKGGHYQKNPFYGGNNPLHLGLCFKHGEEKWISN